MQRNKMLSVIASIAVTICLSFGILACGDDGDDTTYYTVTYSVDSGFGSAPKEISVAAGTVLSAAQLPTLTASGYEFDAWYTSWPSTTKKAIANEYTVTDNVTLCARWTQTLALDANGGSATGTTSLTVKQVDPYLTLPTASDAGLSRSGYTFVCWNTEPDGSGLSHTAGEIGCAEFGLWEIKRLYAMWIPGTSDTIKVATARTAENVLKNLKNGDTLVYTDALPLASDTKWNLPTLFQKYLSDESKKITLNLNYATSMASGVVRYFRYHVGTGSSYHLGSGYDRYFISCKSIKSVSINILSIDEYMFSDCTSLETVTIGEKAQYIYKGAFSGCTALTSVTFTDTTNWYYYEADTKTTLDVSNASTNATNLKSTSGSWYSKTLRKIVPRE